MRATKLLLTLAAMALLSGCVTGVSSRPCPRVTEFPADIQAEAGAEMEKPPRKPALERLLDAMAADRAYNRAICG